MDPIIEDLSLLFAESESGEDHYEMGSLVDDDSDSDVDTEPERPSSSQQVPRPPKRPRPSRATFAQKALPMLPKKMLVILLLLVNKVGMPPDADKHVGVEIFAGVKSITRGFTSAGYKFQSMDWLTSSSYDNINSPEGYLRALYYVVGMEDDGCTSLPKGR